MTEFDASKYLHSVATHHRHDDWEYTRNTGIKYVRYYSDYTGNQTLWNRVKWTLHMLRSRSRIFNSLITGKSWPERLKLKFYTLVATVRVNLPRVKHIPDGTINGNITFWEEDGEYIQVVQPSVGVLVSKFLADEPENPHAKAIAQEIERIVHNYSERNKNND